MDFNTQVEQLRKGTYPKNDMLYLCKTPLILRNLGLDDLPITMTQAHYKTITESSGEKNKNYHGLGDLILKLPAALKQPLKVLNSNSRDDSIVVVTKLKDNQNRPIIASIKYNGVARLKNKQIDSNVLTSAYGKDNYNNYIKKIDEQGNLLYDHKKGIIKRVDKDRIQFPIRANSLDNTISQKDMYVNNSISKDSSKYSIKEEIMLYGYYELEIINYI